LACKDGEVNDYDYVPYTPAIARTLPATAYDHAFYFTRTLTLYSKGQQRQQQQRQLRSLWQGTLRKTETRALQASFMLASKLCG